MYKTLKQLGKRGIKEVKKTNTITKEAFKDHFFKSLRGKIQEPTRRDQKSG